MPDVMLTGARARARVCVCVCVCDDSAPTSQGTNRVFVTKNNGVLQRGIILIYSKSQTEHIKVLCFHE